MKLIPERHFARMLIKTLKDCPYSFFVRSEICGISLRDFKGDSSLGIFSYEFRPSDAGVYQVNIPRHSSEDTSLVLYALIDGEIKASLSLFELLKGTDYDWSDKDLKDIVVNFNYTEQDARFVIQQWNDGDVLDVIYQ